MEKLTSFEVPDSYINGNRENYFVYTGSADSLPYYSKGDILLFCKDISDLKENDVVLVNTKYGTAICKLHIRKNGAQIVKGLTVKLPRKTEFEILGYLYMRFSRYRELQKKQKLKVKARRRLL